MGRMYYKSETTNVMDFLKIEIFDNKCGAFERFAGEIDLMREVEKDDSELEMTKYWIDGKELWVVSIDEEWKHNLFGRLVCIDINLIENIIGDVGIRRAFKIVDECGINDDSMTLEELSSDIGMRKIFYCILDQQLGINDGFDEIDEDEWDALSYEYYEEAEAEGLTEEQLIELKKDPVMNAMRQAVLSYCGMKEDSDEEEAESVKDEAVEE